MSHSDSNVLSLFTLGRARRAVKDGLLASFTGPELQALLAWLDTLETTPETEEIRQIVMMRTTPQEEFNNEH